jgi:hypothetical protein
MQKQYDELWAQIRRLDSQLVMKRIDCLEQCRQIATLRERAEKAEQRIAELEGALRKIRDYTEDTDFPFIAIPRERMIEIAREALDGKEEK